MTVDRRHRFNSINSVTDSSNTVVRDIDSVTDSSNTVVGDIDSAAVDEDINSAAVVEDIDSAAVVWDIDSAVVVGDIDSTAVVGDTITAIGPPVMAVQWSETPIQWAIRPPPQAALLAKPPVLVVYLKFKFKLKKYNH